MKIKDLSLPELGLIAGTRALLGAGAALLLADNLNRDQRKAVGWTLFLIGAISTIPLVIEVLSKVERPCLGTERQSTPEIAPD